jgi:hypothetical protein
LGHSLSKGKSVALPLLEIQSLIHFLSGCLVLCLTPKSPNIQVAPSENPRSKLDNIDYGTPSSKNERTSGSAAASDFSFGRSISEDKIAAMNLFGISCGGHSSSIVWMKQVSAMVSLELRAKLFRLCSARVNKL